MLLLVFQRVRFALGIGGIVLLVLFLVNYYVNQFQGGNLNFSNLLAAGTAATVLGSYQFSISSELWYSILYFCFFIAHFFYYVIAGVYREKAFHITVPSPAFLWHTAWSSISASGSQIT